MKIAIFVNKFPKLSETFIVSQVVGLIDAGYSIKIFSQMKFDEIIIHNIVNKYNLKSKTYYFNTPQNYFFRFVMGVVLFFKYLLKSPKNLFYSINVFKHGKLATSLRLLYSVVFFIGSPNLREYDVIFCHFGINGQIAVELREMGLLKGRIITSFHGIDISRSVVGGGVCVYKMLFKKGDLFLPISDYWKRKLVNLGCRSKKIIVHRMAVDIDMFEFILNRPPDNRIFNIITVGRLVKKKGHKYALMALKRLTNHRKDFRYIIVGNGPLKSELMKLAKKLGISRYVDFKGALDMDGIKNLYNESHIFLLPSIIAKDGDMEGIPITIMEAMACGLPVISTYHSGIPEIITHNKNGFLVRERDVDQLARVLQDIMAKYKKIDKIKISARRKIEKEYNIDIQNRRLINIFISLD